MKRVFVATNPAEAHMCVAALESEGIEAVIQGEYGFGLQGEVPAGPAVRPSVWVADDADPKRVAAVVARFRQ